MSVMEETRLNHVCECVHVSSCLCAHVIMRASTRVCACVCVCAPVPLWWRRAGPGDHSQSWELRLGRSELKSHKCHTKEPGVNLEGSDAPLKQFSERSLSKEHASEEETAGW